MKIAILSMHRVINYGSFLQAYSLKTILESFGHTVQFVDIRDASGSMEYASLYQPQKIKYAIKKAVRKVLRPSYYRASFERVHLFHTAVYPMLGIGEQYVSGEDEHFDLCIIGSDEIFNCCDEGAPWLYSMYLFGKGIRADKYITYAASFGSTTFQKICNAQLCAPIQEHLKQLDSISVRDENSLEIVKQLCDKGVLKNVDPVFLSDYQNHIPKKIRHKNYLLVYGYDGRICEPEIIEEVKRFAKKRGLKTLGLGMSQKWCDDNIVVEPFELLAYFRDAAFVVTDTFHGTVFSIKYQKQFATIIRDSNTEKLSDLLSTFDLLSRSLTDHTKLEDVLTEKYDTERVRDLIVQKRNEGISYVKAYAGGNDVICND